MERKIEHVSEYDEAVTRFKSFQTVENPACPSRDVCNNLDEIIMELCNGQERSLTTEDKLLFFDLVINADFKQIKTDHIETFYATLCDSFLLSGPVDDISVLMNKLDLISHVKKNILQGLLKVLQVKATLEKESLTLSYAKLKTWSDFDLTKVDSIQILPCAYKVMICNDKFSMSHLNFPLRLVELQNVILEGCNLNGQDVGKLFDKLKLKKLNLSHCGTSVNTIIKRSPDIFKNLTDLNIAGNPLYNETLSEISFLPLKKLNIRSCIKTSGYFIDSIWIENFDIGDEQLDTQGTLAKVDIDLLWATGVLKENIENLDVSDNNLTAENLQKILQFNLRELNISRLPYSISLSKMVIPRSLKVLKYCNMPLSYDELEVLCKSHLEKMEIAYIDNHVNYECVDNSSLLNTLTELTVDMPSYSDNFIYFIRKFKLKYLRLNIVSQYFHCQRLQLEKLNITELTISRSCLPTSKYYDLLSCSNLHDSVVSLTLEGRVNNDDLILILKFKKLEKLSFSFNKLIDQKYLKMLVDSKTITELNLEADIADPLDLYMAQLLCIAPVLKLNLKSTHITDEAYAFLKHHENWCRFSKNLDALYVKSVVTSNMAEILRYGDWKIIKCHEKCDKRNLFKILSQNQHLKFSLENLSLEGESKVELSDLANLMLSTLEFESCDVLSSYDMFEVLAKGPLLKFLQNLTYDTSNLILKGLIENNLSQVTVNHHHYIEVDYDDNNDYIDYDDYNDYIDYDDNDGGYVNNFIF